MRRTLSATASLTGVTCATLKEDVLRGGRGEVKSNVGNGKVPLGSEMRGRSGTSATCGQNTDVSQRTQAQMDGSEK